MKVGDTVYRKTTGQKYVVVGLPGDWWYDERRYTEYPGRPGVVVSSNIQNYNRWSFQDEFTITQPHVFKVGDYVTCIHTDIYLPNEEGCVEFLSKIKKGVTYKITNIDDSPIVTTHGIGFAHSVWVYHPDNFRKATSTEIEIYHLEIRLEELKKGL